MSRTFKGYAVRDDEGRWLGHVFNEDSITTVYGDKANRRLWEDAEDAQDAARHDVLSINGFVIVPVFAVPKRRTLTDIPPEVFAYSDNEGGVCLTWPLANAERQRATEEAKGTYKCGPIVRYVPEPKPAPAEGAAEGEYALRDPAGHFVKLASEREIGNRATVEKLKLSKDNIVRILPDGAHEAACEAARREERERIYKLIDDADDDDTEVSEGLKYALLLMRQNGGSK